MTPRDRLQRTWLRVIKRTLNRITLRIARGRRGPFTIVRHRGRRTGTVYETPIIVQPAPGAFIAELTYGPGVQWYRNVVAAGGCELVRHGVTYRIDGVETIDAITGLAAFTPAQRTLLRLLRRHEFRRLVIAAPSAP